MALFGKNFDNCYAEGKDPLKKLKDFNEFGAQAQPSEIVMAMDRKGGDLLTPGVDKEDYSRKKAQKKKRGRKNKYIAAIDAEDDEEADQLSESDDGLDGIKEEDEEDEEERQAKLAKMKELEEAARAAEEHGEWRRLLKKKVELDDMLEKARGGDYRAGQELKRREKDLR